MENGWKMEDGKWKPDSSPFGVAREAVARFARWPFRGGLLSQRFPQADFMAREPDVVLND